MAQFYCLALLSGWLHLFNICVCVCMRACMWCVCVCMHAQWIYSMSILRCSAISATEVFSVLAIQSYAELNQWEQVLPFVTEQYSGIEQCTSSVVQLW